MKELLSPQKECIKYNRLAANSVTADDPVLGWNDMDATVRQPPLTPTPANIGVESLKEFFEKETK